MRGRTRLLKRRMRYTHECMRQPRIDLVGVLPRHFRVTAPSACSSSDGQVQKGKAIGQGWIWRMLPGGNQGPQEVLPQGGVRQRCKLCVCVL